jgi:hypothetical protein
MKNFISMATSNSGKQRGIWHSTETKQHLAVARTLSHRLGIIHGIRYLVGKGWKIEAARFALM